VSKREYKITADFCMDHLDEEKSLIELKNYVCLDTDSFDMLLTNVKIEKVEQRRHGKTKREIEEIIDSLLGFPGTIYREEQIDVFKSILKDFDDEPVEEKVCSSDGCLYCEGTGEIDKAFHHLPTMKIPCPECNSGGGV